MMRWHWISDRWYYHVSMVHNLEYGCDVAVAVVNYDAAWDSRPAFRVPA